MNKPKLPSQMHPDYPKPIDISREEESVRTIKYPAREEYTRFYSEHPEFADEGEYEFLCPYCGNQVEEHGYRSACCGEVGHGEWKYVDANGNIEED